MSFIGSLWVPSLSNFWAYTSWKAILFYVYTTKISFAPLGSSGSPPVAGSSSNPVVSYEGVDVKLVYELATKASILTSSLSLYLTSRADFVGTIARNCISKDQIEHDTRKHRRRTSFHLL